MAQIDIVPNPTVFSLEGQLALITGGTSMITGRREAVLQEAKADLGDAAHYVANDICDWGPSTSWSRKLRPSTARWISWSITPALS